MQPEEGNVADLLEHLSPQSASQAHLFVLKRFEPSSGRVVDGYAESSSCGGGVVSIELISLSWGSEEPEAAGDGVLSLSMADPDISWFMATSTDAASNNCTC